MTTARDWKELAAQAAWATGQTFFVGVRSHNGSWFANCDGIEYDGSDPESATRAVHDAIIEGMKKHLRTTEKEAERTRSALAALQESGEK